MDLHKLFSVAYLELTVVFIFGQNVWGGGEILRRVTPTPSSEEGLAENIYLIENIIDIYAIFHLIFTN